MDSNSSTLPSKPQPTVLELFKRILDDPDVAKAKEGPTADLRKLIEFVLKKFFKAVQDHPFLLLEVRLLFAPSPPFSDEQELTNWMRNSASSRKRGRNSARCAWESSTRTPTATTIRLLTAYGPSSTFSPSFVGADRFLFSPRAGQEGRRGRSSTWFLAHPANRYRHRLLG